jgi:hypothetical protein
MPTIDLAAYAGFLIVVLLALCFLALVLMADTTHAAPHVVVRRVRCGRYGRTAQVEFTERIQSGLSLRSVRHCPLRHEGERCGEACVWEPTYPPAPPA